MEIKKGKKLFFYLIDNTQNLNYEIEPNGETPLFIAFKNKNYNIVKYMLNAKNTGKTTKGIDINYINKYGENIIFYLFKHKAMTYYALSIILSKGININEIDKNGKSALLYATEDFDPKYLKIFIENYIFSPQSISNLILLSKNNVSLNSDEFDKMIAKEYSKIDLNIKDDMGRTPLLRACSVYDIEAVKLLVYSHAKVDICDKNGVTPLMYFYSDGYLSLAKLLLEHGANINAINKYNKTVLHYACENCHKKAVKFFLESGANPNIICSIDGKPYSPIQIAVERNYSKIVDLLLKYHVNPNERVKYGREQEDTTLLIIASKNGNPDIVRSLLCYNASMDSVDSHLKSGLMYAKERNYKEIIDIYEEYEQKQKQFKNNYLSSNATSSSYDEALLIADNIKSENERKKKEEEEEKIKKEAQYKKDLEFTYECIRNHNVMIYYYSEWFEPKASETVNIQYKIGDNRWTPSPGIPMYFSEEYQCYYLKIPLWVSTKIEFYFNDGTDLCDNNNNQNYHLTPGCYTIKNNTINEGTPKKINI